MSSPALARALSTLNADKNRRPRSEKKAIPEDQKDQKYFERRRRNNEAAKKSRDFRKQREDELAIRASFLERSNSVLRVQVHSMREEAMKLRQMWFQKCQLGDGHNARQNLNSDKDNFQMGRGAQASHHHNLIHNVQMKNLKNSFRNSESKVFDSSYQSCDVKSQTFNGGLRNSDHIFTGSDSCSFDTANVDFKNFLLSDNSFHGSNNYMNSDRFQNSSGGLRQSSDISRQGWNR